MMEKERLIVQLQENAEDVEEEIKKLVVVTETSQELLEVKFNELNRINGRLLDLLS